MPLPSESVAVSRNAADETRCFVYENVALVYLKPGMTLPGVLAYPERPLQGSVAPSTDMRPATAADFERFRVCARNYRLSA